MSSVGCCRRAAANWRLTMSLTSLAVTARPSTVARVSLRAAAAGEAAEPAGAAGAEAGDDDRDQGDQQDEAGGPGSERLAEDQRAWRGPDGKWVCAGHRSALGARQP